VYLCIISSHTSQQACNTDRTLQTYPRIAGTPRVHAARLLKQDVQAFTTRGRSPIGALSVTAQAGEAEAKANPRSTGVYHNEAKIFLQSGDLLPMARTTASTANGWQPRGRARSATGPGTIAISAFGTVATADTDTDRARWVTQGCIALTAAVGAWSSLVHAMHSSLMPSIQRPPRRAVSASEAMPTRPENTNPATFSQGTTSTVWENNELHRGIGATQKVYTDSYAVNSLAPLSSGISNVGAGPVAVASAGEAVAMSKADRAE